MTGYNSNTSGSSAVGCLEVTFLCVVHGRAEGATSTEVRSLYTFSLTGTPTTCRDGAGQDVLLHHKLAKALHTNYRDTESWLLRVGSAQSKHATGGRLHAPLTLFRASSGNLTAPDSPLVLEAGAFSFSISRSCRSSRRVELMAGWDSA